MKKVHKGFTLVEIMIVVAIIGLLVAIALPNFVLARKKSQMNTCKANLKQVDGAVSQFKLDGTNSSIVTVTMAMLVPDYIKTTPTCPGGGSYTIVADSPTNAVTCTLGAASYSPYQHQL